MSRPMVSVLPGRVFLVAFRLLMVLLLKIKGRQHLRLMGFADGDEESIQCLTDDFTGTAVAQRRFERLINGGFAGIVEVKMEFNSLNHRDLHRYGLETDG